MPSKDVLGVVPVAVVDSPGLPRRGDLESRALLVQLADQSLVALAELREAVEQAIRGRDVRKEGEFGRAGRGAGALVGDQLLEALLEGRQLSPHLQVGPRAVGRHGSAGEAFQIGGEVAEERRVPGQGAGLLEEGAALLEGPLRPFPVGRVVGTQRDVHAQAQPANPPGARSNEELETPAQEFDVLAAADQTEQGSVELPDPDDLPDVLLVDPCQALLAAAQDCDGRQEVPLPHQGVGLADRAGHGLGADALENVDLAGDQLLIIGIAKEDRGAGACAPLRTPRGQGPSCRGHDRGRQALGLARARRIDRQPDGQVLERHEPGPGREKVEHLLGKAYGVAHKLSDRARRRAPVDRQSDRVDRGAINALDATLALESPLVVASEGLEAGRDTEIDATAERRATEAGELSPVVLEHVSHLVAEEAQPTGRGGTETMRAKVDVLAYREGARPDASRGLVGRGVRVHADVAQVLAEVRLELAPNVRRERLSRVLVQEAIEGRIRGCRIGRRCH